MNKSIPKSQEREGALFALALMAGIHKGVNPKQALMREGGEVNLPTAR